MRKGQINTIILITIIIVGVVLNVYRFFPSLGTRKPQFEIFDVRTFNDLEPTTIVHYQVKNVGRVAANEVLTSISFAETNQTPPAYFPSLPPGEAVSVNRKIPLGHYVELQIGVVSIELSKPKYYTVKTDVPPEPPQKPDFIVYNLTFTSLPSNNQTVRRAVFWIMNIGGTVAHEVQVSLYGMIGTTIDLLAPGESKMLPLDLTTITWEGLDVEISCSEGIKQAYFLIEYEGG